MIQLLYLSRAEPAVDAAETRRILEVSRANNARLGVTGLLLRAGDTFVQVLEGEAATVAALVERIRRDRRHRSVLVALERKVDAPTFGAWSMGFTSVDPALAGEGQVVDLSRVPLAELAQDRGAAILDAVARLAGPGLAA